jgi:dynein heavy chain, axonemal
MVLFYDYVAAAQTRLQRTVTGIEDLRFVMDCLKEVKAKDSGIDHEIQPILDMYTTLALYLPDGSLDMSELDQKETLRLSWRRVIDIADEVTVRVAKLQVVYKRRLLHDIKSFVDEVVRFRDDYVSHGPNAPGLTPQDAMDRLR